MVEPAFAAGEGEEGFDQCFLSAVGVEELFGSGAPCRCAGVRILEGELEHGALRCERGAQLVGGVGDEVPLRFERRVEAPEQVVQGVPELLQLVVGPAEGEALSAGL